MAGAGSDCGPAAGSAGFDDLDEAEDWEDDEDVQARIEWQRCGAGFTELRGELTAPESREYRRRLEGRRVDALRPRDPADRRATRGPTLDATRLVFGRQQLTWARWTDVWQSADGRPQPQFGPPEGELTPPPRLPGPPGANGSACAHTTPAPPAPEADE